MMLFASRYTDPLAWKYVRAIPDSIAPSRMWYALQWSTPSEDQTASPASLPPRITKFESDGTSLTVQGDASTRLIYGSRVDEFLRTAEFSQLSDLVISDSIRLRAPGQISWLLHSTVPFETDAGTNRFRLRGRHYSLEGTFETSAPVSTLLTKGFPVPPAAAFKTPQADGIPERQFHLEWKTTQRLTEWSPRLRVRITRNM